MTSKEIIRTALRLEPTPRLPVSLLSAGAWTLNSDGLTLEQALAVSPERFAEVVAATNEKVGCDIVWPGSGYHNLALRGVGGEIKFRTKGTPDVRFPLVAEPGELVRFDPRRVQDDPGVRHLAAAAGLLVRAFGVHTVVGTSQWAPFTLGGLAYGVEKLMRNIRKDPAAVHAVLAWSTELCFAYLEPFIAAGVSMISLADPTASGDLISREQFAEFALPHLRTVAQRLRARGVWVTVHICGNTTNRLDLIPGAGADLMSVDYKVDLAAARRALGGRIVFAGNMNPVAVMQKETPEGVAAACRACIQSAGTAPGFLLMPGCDIPPSVPLDNVRAMVATARATIFAV
jgi:uroporphyrinogen decarboxylase